MKTLTLFLGIFATVSSVRAGDAPKSELLPLPREVAGQEVLPAPRAIPAQDILPAPRALGQPLFIPYIPSSPPGQYGRRSVWQMMAPGHNGMMLPRVIYSPVGSYYLYNGQPYPSTTIRPNLYQGTIFN